MTLQSASIRTVLIQIAMSASKKPVVRQSSRNRINKTVQIESVLEPIKATGSTKKSKCNKNGEPNCKKKLKIIRKCCEQKRSKSVEENAIDLEEDEDGFAEIGDRSKPKKRRDPSKWKRNIEAKLKRDLYEQQSSSSIPNEDIINATKLAVRMFHLSEKFSPNIRIHLIKTGIYFPKL